MSGDNYMPCDILETTTYSLFAMDGNGCYETETFEVIVNPLPEVDLTTNNNVIYVDSANLTSASWTFNGSPVSSSGFNLHPAQEGWYTVSITDLNGCTNVDSINFEFVSVMTWYQIVLGIYPNPASNEIIIEVPHQALEIDLVDMFGRIIYKENLPTQSNHKLNIRTLPKGVYYVIIKAENEVYRTSFVKQ
jgi:hypothetical protein